MRPFSITITPFWMSGPDCVMILPVLITILPPEPAGASRGAASAGANEASRARAVIRARFLYMGVFIAEAPLLRRRGCVCAWGRVGSGSVLGRARIEHQRAVDDHADDARGGLERFAVPEHEVGVLADLEA